MDSTNLLKVLIVMFLIITVSLILKYILFDYWNLNFTLACFIHFIACFGIVTICNLLIVHIITNYIGYLIVFIFLLLITLSYG